MNEILVYLTAGGSCGLFFWSLFNAYDEVTRRSELNPERRIWIKSIFFRLIIPFAQPFAAIFTLYSERLLRWEAQTGRKSSLLSMRKRLRRVLIAAGSPEGITPDEFIGIVIVSMILAGVVGVVVFALLAWRGFQTFGSFCWLAAVLLGLALPLFWLRDNLRVRKFAITKALPYALDLLTLCVEAGMDFTTALARIIQKLGDQPLSYEFAEMLRQIRMGRTRADALRELSERVDVPEMTSVTSSLIQADELGASLGPVLRIQSDQLRVRRSQRAEKLASEAPVKMLFPLVAFIFPTIFIMIGGAVFLKLYYKVGL